METEDERQKALDLAETRLFYLVLVLLGTAGLWLIGRPEALAQHIGTALIVAAILGASVDLLLKKRIQRDAVHAALGYLLPPALRPELRWIYEQSLFWEDWDITATLKPEPGKDYVVMQVTLTRTLVNRGAKTAKEPHITVSLDDWLFERPSRITDYGFIYRKKQYSLGDGAEIVEEPHNWRARPLKAIELDTGERVKCWVTYEEVRRPSDSIHLGTRYPVIAAKAELIVPEEYEVYPVFDSRMKGEYERLGKTRYVLHAAMLPYHGFRVRWWKKPSGKP